MSSYSVVVSLKDLTKKEIRVRLRATFGASASARAIINEAGSPAMVHQACTSAGHFGCVHWTEDDLRSKCNELDVPVTKEILDRAKSSYALRHIDDIMIERGWELIEEAIIDAQSDIDKGNLESKNPKKQRA